MRNIDAQRTSILLQLPKSNDLQAWSLQKLRKKKQQRNVVYKTPLPVEMGKILRTQKSM